MTKVAVPKLKIMVASTIYNFEDQLTQICALLQSYGYEVWNSHLKTIPVHPGLSNTENCLRAVAACDLFFGIVRPQYGAVLPGADFSITHQEIRKAIELKKSTWFIAHRDIFVARALLKQYMLNEDKTRNLAFTYSKTAILDDIRVIGLYNEIIQDDVPADQRVGHWIDQFFTVDHIFQCIQTQLKDIDRVRNIIRDMEETEI